MRIAVSLVVVAGAFACAGSRAAPEQASGSAQTSPSRAWIDMRGANTEKLFVRESTDLSEVAVGSADARFSGKTLALQPATFVPDQKTESLSAKLAPSETLECTVRAARLFHGDGIRFTIESLRKSVDVRAVVPVDVLAIAGGPLFLVDVLYFVHHGAETALGEFKLSYFSRPGLTLICSHDGAGYRETFVRAVSLLASTIRDAKAEPPPEAIFSAVSRVRIGARVVGWSQVREIEPDADGSYQAEEYTSMLLPGGRDPAAFLARDTSRVERFDSSRALVHGSYSLGKDSVWTDWKLLPRENLAYGVEGTEGDKPMTGVVQAHRGLRDIPAATLLDVANGHTNEVLFDAYSPARPLEIAQVTVVRDPKVERGVVYRIGGVPSISLALDETGAPLLGSMPLGDGSVALTFERIWSSGKPR